MKNQEGTDMQPTKIQDRRTSQGLPDIADESELQGFNWAQVNGGGEEGKNTPQTVKIDQSKSNNRNDALPYLIGAWVFATIAMTLCVVGYIFGPSYIKAQMRAEMSQDIADVRAESRAAGTDAAIAKNTVQKLEARLNERR